MSDAVLQANWVSLVLVVLRMSVVLTSAVCACLVLQRVLRRSSAAVRHAIWVASLSLGVMLPLAVLAPFRWGEARVAAPALVEIQLEDGPPAELNVRPTSDLPAPTALMVFERSSAERVARALATLWLLGVALQILRFGSAAWRLRRMMRAARRIEPNQLADCQRASERPVPVLESVGVALPMAAGWAQPFILLPAGASTSWSRRRLLAALLHERAHIQRGDIAWHVLARVCCALHWFNPLIWLAARRCALEAEHACDDAVLRAGVRPSSYAGHLLEIARVAARPGGYAPAVGQGSVLEGRISAVLAPRLARRGLPGTVLLTIVVGTMLSGAAFGTHRGLIHRAAAAQQRPANASEDRGAVRFAGALVRLLHDSDPAVRAAAARSSGELRIQAAVPLLVDALGDPVAGVRQRAAHSLGELENASAILPLQRVLLSDPSGAVRREAAAALGEIETEEAAAVLRAAVERTGDHGLRRTLIRALGETGSPSAIPLLESLITAHDEWTTRAALEALEQIGSPQATDALLRAMRSESALIRRLAARAIAGD